ncbi:MAG TPA: EcsC family protein [Thermoanaerobaculia bacterium]|nr:EcsC family protein [Thermoanaerobaculia bacterium]
MMEITKRDLPQRFYDLLERLFQELDQEAIEHDVAALREQSPDASNEKLAELLIRRAARRAATVGAAAGTAGGAVGLLAMAPDIFNLVRQQSRLILAIAFLYGQKPRLPERFREVMATLAVSTGATLGRQGVRRLVALGLEKEAARRLAKGIAGRYLVRRLPAVAPLIGSALGGTLNYLAVRAVGRVAIGYYARVQEEQRQLEAVTIPVEATEVASEQRPDDAAPAGARKRKAEGGRQKAEGGKQKAEGGKRKGEGGREKAEGRKKTSDGR